VDQQPRADVEENRDEEGREEAEEPQILHIAATG